MKPKANLVLLLSVIALVLSVRGQEASNPPVPSVPRADGTGPSAPSMSPAVGDIAVPPASPKGSAHPHETVPPAADLDAAVKATALAPLSASTPGSAPLAATTNSSPKTGPNLPANKGWALEGSPTVSVTGPASPVSESLDTTTLAEQIKALPLAGRADFLAGLDTRIESTDRELNQVRQTSRQLKGEARAAYLAADEDVKVKHKALKRSLKDAHAAPPESWAKARNALAADYEAYSVALVRMEASSAVGR